MNVTPIVNAVIAILAALISAFVIPWIKRKADGESLKQLQTWVNIAVTAAEQLYTSMDGNAKKQYVLNYLSAKGYDVNAEDIQNTVEAAVLQLHNELYGTEKVIAKGDSNA